MIVGAKSSLKRTTFEQVSKVSVLFPEGLCSSSIWKKREVTSFHFEPTGVPVERKQQSLPGRAGNRPDQVMRDMPLARPTGARHGPRSA